MAARAGDEMFAGELVLMWWPDRPHIVAASALIAVRIREWARPTVAGGPSTAQTLHTPPAREWLT